MHSVFAGSMRRLSLWMLNLRRYWHDLACNVMGYSGASEFTGPEKQKAAPEGGVRLLTNLGQGQNGLRFTERHRFKT
ncbi:hypothetical protein B3286c2_0543 [Brucella vulpis]|nr:hypothetical protein BF3285c2_0548 [Brucella vulpis]CUW51560.1 hypothetical protein B3286c2_0543 [Brucella vulpis]